MYVFLQDGYDPKPDPNSNCTKKIVEELLHRGQKVFVVCDGCVEYKEEFSYDEHIIHIPCKSDTIFENKNILGKIVTCYKRVLSIPIWPIRFPGKVNRYFKRIGELVESHPEEDIKLIAVYKPAEMLEVAYRIKKKYSNCQYIAYSLDGIGANFLRLNIEYIKRKEKKWLKKRLEAADLIIQMACHKTAYQGSEYKSLLYKTTFCDFPMIDFRNKDFRPLVNSKKQKVMIYAGSFYKNLREPTYMLNWFKSLSEIKPYFLQIYTEGEFLKDINAEEKKTKGRISRQDYLPTYALEKVLEKADVLLSIGNHDSQMVPSKIFQYISMLKPVIHFCDSLDDSSISYLKRYPFALILNQNDTIENNIKKFLAFEDTINNAPTISISQMQILFHDNAPSATVDILMRQ